MDEKEMHLKLIIDSSFSQIAPLALAVRGICQIIPMSPVEINRIELCVVEIVNNAIEHAYSKQEGNEVSIAISILKNYLLIKVYDNGKPLSKAKITKKNSLVDADNALNLFTCGRGLDIVRSLMDAVDYNSESGVNCFTMKKVLNQ